MNATNQTVLKQLETLFLPGQNKNIIESGYIQNVNVFGKKIIIDLVLDNPALHAQKKIELTIAQHLEKSFGTDYELNLNKRIVTKQTTPIGINANSKKIDGVKHIIAFASGKGGVGKSTITANCARALTQHGLRVGILDADIYGPSIPIMFNVEDAKPKARKIDGQTKMIPVTKESIDILSIGFFALPSQAVIWRGPMATKAIRQMLFDTHWNELDILLIDLPPGTGDIHLSIVQSIPLTGAVIVSTPQKIALADAKKGIAMFQQESINVPVLGLIENMAYFTPAELPKNKYYLFGEKGVENLATESQIPFLGEIPIVQSIREACDAGTSDPLHTKPFETLSANLLKQLQLRTEQLPPTQPTEITHTKRCDAKNNVN